MLSELKKMGRRSTLYRRWQQHQAMSALRRWTPLDLARRDFYAQLIGMDDIVFDVGANMANRTRVFRELARKVVAVEPQPLCLKVLRRKFGSDPKVTIVDSALGGEAGTATLNFSDEHTLATLSTEWIRAVKTSGRFADQRWRKQITVPVTTLSKLIETYGAPAFVKIDVEGHEEQVLRGLSKPVRMLSFEFVPEQLDSAIACIELLEALAPGEYNVVLGEATRFENDRWVHPGAFIRDTLRTVPSTAFGDIYARFKT
jgi:FkbM family methyltransferase